VHLKLGRIEGFVFFYINYVDRRLRVVSTLKHCGKHAENVAPYILRG
jgi:hypothetical protein